MKEKSPDKAKSDKDFLRSTTHPIGLPSVGFLAKLSINKERQAHRMTKEGQARRKERTAFLAIEVQKAVLAGDDVRNIYDDTVNRCVLDNGSKPEDQEVLRLSLTGVIFKWKVFRILYRDWKIKWDTNPVLRAEYNGKQKLFRDYISDRAKAFIDDRRDEIIAARLHKFQKDAMPYAGSETDQEAQFNDIHTKTMLFIDKYKRELLEYSELDAKDPKRQQLFKKFLTDTGLIDLKPDKIELARQLFEDIIDDLKVAFAAGKKFNVLEEQMMERAQKAFDNNEDIEDEEWDKMFDDLQEDRFLNQVIQQHHEDDQQYNAIVDVGINKAAISAIKDLALVAGGLSVVGPVVYDKKIGSYSCTVSYPGDTQLKTKMTIVRNTNIKDLDKKTFNFNDATFIFFNKYSDEDKAYQLSVTRQDLQRASNQILLDKLMNKPTVHREAGSDFDANDILKDDKMMSIAERFFGFNLNEVVLTKKMQNIFGRFFDVLQRADEQLPSFKQRIDAIDLVLMNPENRGVSSKLYLLFEKASVVNFTISSLLQNIGFVQ